MPYKTIVVHVEESPHLEARVRVAAEIALAEGAHLVGACMTGVAKVVYESMADETETAYTERFLRIAEQRAHAALERFKEAVRQCGVTSWEARLIDDEPAAGISVQGRYCDLLVIGQPDPAAPSPAVYSDFPEYVILNCGCPVLMVPYATDIGSTGENVLIAWNASAESTRAVHSAIPLLRRAKLVRVAVFNPDSLPDAHGEEPGADIALYLARHDITVEVTQHAVEGDVGDALLSLANSVGSDLLVMGCYGHSRFREILLGGATRTVLQSATLPVLMSH